MKELMFQTWPDTNGRWHWVVFTKDPYDTVESPRTFQSSEEADWDVKRFIETRH